MEAPWPRGDNQVADLAGEPAVAFIHQVHDALTHLYDAPHLQIHPLALPAAREPGVPASSAGKALHQGITSAIESLRPEAGDSLTPKARRGYRLLVERYVEGNAIAAVAAKLGISETEYYREQQRALAGLASLLWERWGAHWRQPNSQPRPISVSTASSHPASNLPVAITSFVGRERELATVIRRLETTRLFTITGPGGCGKTRLAAEVVRSAADRFPDGVWFVDFAGLSDPSLAVDVIAGVLGCVGSHGDSSLQAVARMLARRRALLLLDNCERLVGVCAELVESLLQACPHLLIVVTSRERLRIPGESIFVVPPLPAPPPDRETTVVAAAGFDAIRLFVDRAVEVDPVFELRPDNAGVVAEICRRLDGNPLAIELAAARLRVLPVAELLARLADRFQVLTSGSRTAQRRHQTLSAMVGWSYDLLPDGERALFDRLSVFASGWGLEAAESVCTGGAVESGQTLDLLERLVDKSLVVFVETQGLGARYRLLETLREYGRDRLAKSGEADGIRDRHADYHLALAERAEPELTGPGQREWVLKLALDQDNLRQAFRHLLDWESPVEALRLAGALWRFWAIRGQCGEGRLLLGEALANARPVVVNEAARSWLARSLLGAGALAMMQGDYVKSRAQLTESVELFRSLGDQRSVAWSLIYLCWAIIDSGDAAGAQPLLEQALEASRAAGDRLAEAWALARVALAAHFQRDSENARVAAHEAIRLSREMGDRWGTAWSQHVLACSSGIADPIDDTVERLERESIVTWRELGSRRDLAYSLYELSLHHIRAGHSELSEPLLREALPISLEIGDQFGVISGVLHWATLFRMTDLRERALRLVNSVLAAHESGVITLVPLYRAWCDRIRSRAADELGVAAVEAARAEGRALTLDQAVDFALGR
jgi:predicted ATPase